MPKRVLAEWMAQPWPDGKRMKAKFGNYPSMSPAQAREVFKRDYADLIQNGRSIKIATNAHPGTVADLFEAYVQKEPPARGCIEHFGRACGDARVHRNSERRSRGAMGRHWDMIPGDTPGTEWRIPVLRYRGKRAHESPTVYIQAGLHGDELPGVGTIHALCDLLRDAEESDAISSDITIVPWANPIGLAQQLYGLQQGRFELGSRVNFNRDFPMLKRPDPSGLPAPGDLSVPAYKRLKARLLTLAVQSDIVLDLHCDDESVPYLYIHTTLWPQMQDLAEALAVEAVLLWDDDGGSAFEEACIFPWLEVPKDQARLDRRVVTTVELRGRKDVSESLGRKDAAGIFYFLIKRGAIEGKADLDGSWRGLAAPISHVEMIRAPVGGVVWYDRAPGDQVEEGDVVATIIMQPGDAATVVKALSPQAGYVLTRREQRMTRSGEDLMKVIGRRPSASAKPGALEAR